ncbi:PocR ligand-binding domain-containing protein [Candidatus Omnitrophota bacterium]
MADQHLSLASLIDIKKWQKIQDNFSLVTDTCLRLVDESGNLVTKPSWEPRLCGELHRNSPTLAKICSSCLPTFLGGKGVVEKNLSYECDEVKGLHTFIAPLTSNNKTLGYFLVGPLMLVARRPKEEYSEAAERLGVDLEDLWSAILEIKVTSFSSAQSLLELIRDLGEYTLQLSYQSQVREKEVVMSLGSFKLAKFLEALLDVAFEISGADVGSVMFYDRDNNELTIRASKGIPEDIVKNARVKVGTHISGIAVKEGKSFLIDEKTSDNRITPYLKRPQISSSMVMPFKIENRVAGVMNVGALDTSSVRFSQNNMRLMNRLLDLTALAIHT